MKKYFIIFIIALSVSPALSQNWQPLGSGISDIVYSLYSPWDGRADMIIAGGSFTTAGGVSAHNLAVFSNGAWSQYGGTDGPVYAIYGNYIGGDFAHVAGDTIYYTAKLTDSWGPVVFGLGGPVFTLGYYIGGGFTRGILAGGSFTYARYGFVTLNRIALLSDNAWLPLDSGANYSVNAVCMYHNQLIIGGEFTAVSGVNASHIAKWNGSSWEPLGSGMNNNVWALTVYNDELIAGGGFSNAGGVPANNIAKWNGTSWSPLGNGLNNYVHALALFNKDLVVGGLFNGSGSATVRGVARWNGTTWRPMGSGMNYSVRAFTTFVNSGEMYDSINSEAIYTLVAGGDFTIAGGVSANRIAKWVEHDSSYKDIYKKRASLNKPINPHGNTFDSVTTFPHDNSVFYVKNVILTVDTVNYSNDQDLEFYLIHQSAADTVIYHAGGNGSNFTGTNLLDSGPYTTEFGSPPFRGEFAPYKPLSVFNNLNPEGIWVLKIHNNGSSAGTLAAWSLRIVYGPDPIGITPVSTEIPKAFHLFQNYPNPFNPATKIRFGIPSGRGAVNNAKLVIYDIIGREIQTLLNEQLSPGTYEIEWDASNYPSGVYFYQLIAGDFIQSKKMILVK